MKQANMKIRHEIHEAGFTQWQVAEVIGINATTLTVWLRTPLNDGRLKRIESAIDELKKEVEFSA